MVTCGDLAANYPDPGNPALQAQTATRLGRRRGREHQSARPSEPTGMTEALPPLSPPPRPPRTRPGRRQVAIALVAIVALVCGVVVAVVVVNRSSQTFPHLTLDECDPAGYAPCNQQASFLSIPIADTGLSLTYSSQWAAGRKDRPGWAAGSLGLGGWSLDVVQRYDAANGVLVSGEGSWRFAQAAPMASGERAVPTYDGATAFIFNAAGRHVRTVDGHLGTVQLTIAYDSAGRLTHVDGRTNGGPARLSVQRARSGTPLALVGIDGAITSLSLDRSGRLVGIRDPAGGTTQLAWAAGGLVTSETDALGGVTRFGYDENGRLIDETDADGVAQQLIRTSTGTGVEVRVRTTLGRVSVYGWQTVGGGVRRTFAAPGGATTTETTAGDGSLALALPDGTTRSIGALPSPIWGMAAPFLTPNVETRPGAPVSRTLIHPDLHERGGVPFTVSGSVTTTVNGQRWVETWDPAARTTTLVDPVGRRSIDTYDGGGRLVAASGPGSAPITYAYDARGRETSETIGSGGLAQTTRYAYDAATGKITTTLPDGRTETLAVDANGSATSITAPDGSTAVETSDAVGRLTQVQPPGGVSFTLGSSPAGRPTAFLPPEVGINASIETAAYDGDGNLATISGLGARPVSIAYDAAGRVVGQTFDQGTATASYGQTSGLLTQTSGPGGVTTGYGYAGNVLDKLTWAGPLNGSVTVSLDANGRAVSESSDGASPITLAYDGSGDLTGVGQLSLTRDPTSALVTHTTLSSVATDQQYNASDQLVRATTIVSGKVVLDIRYTRDAMGRMTSLLQTGPDGSTSRTTYVFDADGRLAQVQVNGVTVETDTYDAAGNRTKVSSPSGVMKATYDARDRLVTWGTTGYSWAPDGTLAGSTGRAGATTFTFDDFGRLRAVTPPSGRAVTYLVDADGRRIGRDVGGKLAAGYLYDPAGNVVAVTDGSGTVVERFGYDELGHLALVVRGGTTYRVITDPLGSPRLVIDSQSGAIVDAINYDAWGRITSETAPGLIPFGFDGGLVDPDTGLVHFGARDYDPATGRWTASDPLQFAGGDANLYRYAGGDPVNNADPSGLLICRETGRGSTCYQEPPQPTPPPSAPSPPSPPGSGGNETCFGGCGPGQCLSFGVNLCLGGPGHFFCYALFACGQEGNGSCVFGVCANGPNGFICVALLCAQPDWNFCTVYCSYGDTHLTTADRVHVDFQAAGEFDAIESPDGNLHVQVRQQLWPGYTTITVATAVAADVDGDRVGVYTREPSFLLVNGAPVNATDISEKLPHGGSLQRHGGVVILTWLDNSQLSITNVAGTLSYSLHPAAAAGSGLTGLVGSAGVSNAVKGRDGTVLDRSDPAFSTKLYTQFGNSWRISQAESLFDYQPGESTATFTRLDVPTATVTTGTLASSVRASAEAICRAVGVEAEPLLDDCILDVGVTGDPAFAASEAAIAASGTGSVVTSGTGKVRVLTLGQAVSGNITSPGQHDDYTLAATAGEIVYLKAQGACVTGLGWDLLRPDGSLAAFGVVCQDMGRVVLPTAGVWTVRENWQGTASGPYAFTVLPVAAPSTRPLSLGELVSGSISQIGQVDDYTFTATAGETVYLKAHGACVAGLGWVLLRPDGGLANFGVACQDMGRFVLSTAGIWTVQVTSQGTVTGAYAFTVSTSQ